MTSDLAHRLFTRGDFIGAFRLSRQLIQNGCPASATPIAKCYARVVADTIEQGNPEEAYSLLITGLGYGFYDPNLDAAFEGFVGSSDATRRGKLIFGLGTGRSGSTSLWKILDYPSNSYVSHEHPFLVRWKDSLKEVDWHLKRMMWLSGYYDFVGDVSHWWLPYVEYILKAVPDASFVALKRPKESTIESFLRIKAPSINHWTNHDGEIFRENYWDPCYPSYGEGLDLADALGRYWDDYYERCASLTATYPEQFVTLDLDQLSCEPELRAVLSSVGVDIQLKSLTRNLNVASIEDSRKKNAIPLRAFRREHRNETGL